MKRTFPMKELHRESEREKTELNARKLSQK